MDYSVSIEYNQGDRQSENELIILQKDNSAPQLTYYVQPITFSGEESVEPWSGIKFRSDSSTGEDVADLGVMVFEEKSQ